MTLKCFYLEGSLPTRPPKLRNMLLESFLKTILCFHSKSQARPCSPSFQNTQLSATLVLQAFQLPSGVVPVLTCGTLLSPVLVSPSCLVVSLHHLVFAVAPRQH